MEKVIREWRIIETDDGFRIEIKGDKEAMRDWMERFKSGRRRHWAHHRRPFGPWSARFWHHGPWCCEEDEEESEEEKAA
jgi:hypothetical protein